VGRVRTARGESEDRSCGDRDTSQAEAAVELPMRDDYSRFVEALVAE
jgi:hypothetical protein